MSVKLPIFQHEVPARAMQRQVQWYEFAPADSNGFRELIVKRGRKAIHRVDVFRSSELIQSTSPTDAPEFDILEWNDRNLNSIRHTLNGASEFKSLERFYLQRGDVIFVRVEADLPAAYTLQLAKSHVMDISNGANSVLNIASSTTLVLDQGDQPCNFSIDFGEILPTDFILYDGPTTIMAVPIVAQSKVQWSYDPGKDRRIRLIELSSLVPYQTNFNIVRDNG